MQRQITPNGYHNNRDINSPSHNDSDYKYGRFDASALHIAHALKQTELQKAYNKRREKPIDYYLVSHGTLLFVFGYDLLFYSFSPGQICSLRPQRICCLIAQLYAHWMYGTEQKEQIMIVFTYLLYNNV